MAKFRRTALAAVVVLAAVAVVGVVDAPAWAVSPAVGTITCHYGATLSFSPPLVPGPGTAGYHNETVTIAPASLSGCTRSAAGTVPASGRSTAKLTVIIPGAKFGTIWKAGGCGVFASALWPRVSTSYAWKMPSGPAIANSPTVILKTDHPVTTGTHEISTVLTGTGTGSFPGKDSLTMYDNAASTIALHKCVVNGIGTVHSITLDKTNSVLVLG